MYKTFTEICFLLLSPSSDWFSRNWLKLTKMLPSSSVPLSNMLFLSNELSQLVKEGSMEKEICFTLWISLANDLASFIAKVSFVFGTVLVYSQLASFFV